ncbi:MAG: heat shock protein HspQ [Rhodospirillales bacterium]|jgi:heat shock protein HspQ|nr:heat shock protein HspQ [Rhodospirillales bacterium]
MSEISAKFSVGQMIHHGKFDYRGVIIDVDSHFRGTEDWYDKMAISKPPRDRPWYHVLVDGSDLRTYVAERNLEPDYSGAPIQHPDIAEHFEDLTETGYISRTKMN